MNIAAGTNWICLKYLAVNTDQETNPRKGNLEWSRIDDSYEIDILTADPGFASAYVVLASVTAGPVTVTDRRTYLFQQSNTYMQSISIDQRRGAIDITNNSTLIGINISNDGTGNGLEIANSSSGRAFDINDTYAGTPGVATDTARIVISKSFFTSENRGLYIDVNDSNDGNLAPSKTFGLTIDIAGLVVKDDGAAAAILISPNTMPTNNDKNAGMMIQVPSQFYGIHMRMLAGNSRNGIYIDGFTNSCVSNLIYLIPKAGDSNISAALHLHPQNQPAAAVGGDIYIDEDDNHMYAYINAGWRQLDN